MDEERFELVNDPPAKRPVVEDDVKCRQKVLFTGLNCLPGQQDLFDDLDGEAP